MTDNEAITQALDEMREQISCHARVEAERAALEASHEIRQAGLKLFASMVEADIAREKAETLRRLVAADEGFYCSWTDSPGLHVDTVLECAKALRIAEDELGLGPSALVIRWFHRPPDQSQACANYYSGDPSYFSCQAGTRAFVSWTTVAKTGCLYVANDLSMRTAETIMHEAKHVEQARRLGGDEPTGAVLNELEFQARASAAEHYLKIRESRK
jgi:hypothetical protein